MSKNIRVNGYTIEVEEFNQEVTNHKRKISFKFKVTSEEYHEVTTLLYENNFLVEIPDENIAFQATISNYSTSITDLYKENQVGTFSLELIEK